MVSFERVVKDRTLWKKKCLRLMNNNILKKLSFKIKINAKMKFERKIV